MMRSLLAACDFKRAFWPLLLASSIVFASGWPVPPAIPLAPWVGVDKIGHFFTFGLLATLIARSIRSSPSSRRALFTAFLITTAFGCADEIHQSTNAVRMFSLADALADASGAAVAVFAYGAWPRYRRILEHPVPLPFSSRATPETR